MTGGIRPDALRYRFLLTNSGTAKFSQFLAYSK